MELIMTKEEYWEKLVKKNKLFKNDVVKITTKSLKKIIFQAYNKGFEENKNDNKKEQNDSESYYYDIIYSLFGLK